MSTGSYVGQTFKNKRNGIGTYIYKNGYYKYEGEWFNGKKCGNGRFFMKDGSIYEGSFIDGEMCGSGRRFYAISKNEYIGHFMFGERQGYGLMRYGDGSTYKGDWHHNVQQGHGEFVDVDKCKYVGGFFQNKRNGPGCLYSHKFYYIGYWNNNIFHGNGILKMINGIKYEGEFKNGKPNGQGKLTRKTNLLPNYEGFWKDGLPCQAANHMKLSIESDKQQHSKTNSTCLVEYRNSPLDEKNYKFASFSKMEIASHELKTKCNIDVCIYSDSGKILIEESNRQLALWIGKICKDNIQMRISVDCQISVETPLLLSLREKGIYTIQTPFGSRIYPVGSVTLISNKTVVEKDISLVHSSTDHEDINHAVSNLTLNEEDNANQRLVNKIFVYKQFTNRGFTTYSIIKKSSINNDKNTNETIQTEHNIVDDLTSTPALDEDEYSIDLSQIEKSVLSFEEYINSSQPNPLQLDEQFILVVEDITPQNEEKDEEFHLDTIPDHILKTPESLSPLFIKLCYTSTK